MKKSYLVLLPLVTVFLICGGSTCADDLARWAPKNELHKAAANNDLYGIDLALSHGNWIEIRDERLNTALHFSASYGRPEATRRLLERGADKNARDYSGRTPLHLASPERGWRSYRHYPETMEVLLNFGAQINAIDSYGETPLHRAVFWEITENIELLVRWGADRSIRNFRGQTAFDLASEMFRSEERWIQDCRQIHNRICTLDRFNRLSEILRHLN